MTERRGGALEGIRVIDLTQMLAGPYCTQMLADQGADVIKVEPPKGDSSRKLGPYRADDDTRSIGGYFASVNRNKKSIIIDLKAEEGRALLRRLVRTADVVVENYRARVMDRLGLSYESLRDENPALVYAAIRGFGDPRTGESPYVDWPAFDVVAQAMGGLMGITGPDADTPIKVGPGLGDIVPGAFAATGILAALVRAKMTGRGQFVDICMIDVVLSICERIVHQNSYAGVVSHPEGNQHPILTPFGVFPASDGYVSIGAPTDEWWQKLCHLMQRDDLIADADICDQCAAYQKPRACLCDCRRLHAHPHQEAVDGDFWREDSVRPGLRHGRHRTGPAFCGARDDCRNNRSRHGDAGQARRRADQIHRDTRADLVRATGPRPTYR